VSLISKGETLWNRTHERMLGERSQANLVWQGSGTLFEDRGMPDFDYSLWCHESDTVSPLFNTCIGATIRVVQVRGNTAVDCLSVIQTRDGLSE
jgi:hypothetical protein